MQRNIRRAIRLPSRGAAAAAPLLLAALVAVSMTRPASLPGQDRDPDRWNATAELTLTDASGNQNVSIFTAGLRLQRRQPERYGMDLRLQARYGASERDGERERVAESYRGILNVDIRPGRTWTPFVHSTAEHDPFRRLQLRMNSGAGAKFRLFANDGLREGSISLALLYAYESLTNGESNDVTSSARWSLHVNGEQRLGEGVTLGHTTKYQPIYRALDDYLLNVETALKVMLTRRVALSVSHEFERDSTPAPGVGRNDRLLRVGVIISL